MSAVKLAHMANHPNRGGGRFNRTGANPTATQIVELRNKHGLTQTDLGNLVYKGLRTVQDWEGGERRMPPDTWELLNIKLKARDLLKRGRIAPLAVQDLGLELPND